jgi:hypothetical protein
MTSETEYKQEVSTHRKPNGQFDKGNKSGGRTLGSKNKATLMVEAMLHDATESLMSKVLEMAQKGDASAMKLCIDRLVPVSKDRYMPYNIAALDDINKAPELMLEATNALLRGDIGETQMNSLCNALEQCRKSYEQRDITARLDTLSEKLGFKV